MTFFQWFCFLPDGHNRFTVFFLYLQDVKFSLSLDVFDLCSEELQKKLTPNRLKFKEYEEAAMERAVKVRASDLGGREKPSHFSLLAFEATG